MNAPLSQTQSDNRSGEVISLDSFTRNLRTIGWVGVTVFLGGALLWSATTHLDAAAVAAGTVAVESNRKSIQHFEGGIIKIIHVREGDTVIAGQLLVTLDDTGAGASLEVLQGQYDGTLAMQARLRAERDGNKSIVFPPELQRRAADDNIRALMRTQNDVMESRRSLLGDQVELLQRKHAGEKNKISGYKRLIAANRRELSVLNEEIDGMAGAVSSGAIARTTLLALKRQVAASEAQIAQNETQLAETRKALSEVSSQLQNPGAQIRNEVTTQLQEVEERLGALREKILSARDVLTRTHIRAPQAGTIVGLNVHTTGGVIQPGQQLMDLVPDDDRLVIESRVDPKDMASVYKGMPARVMVTAFNPRTTPPLEGKVVSVSADRIVDPVTGAPYFEVRVEPDANTPDQDTFYRTRLMPGMTAQVFLLKESRTVLDYALEPLLRAFAVAGRED